MTRITRITRPNVINITDSSSKQFIYESSSERIPLPRQRELPHISSPKGPCDAERDAYSDALEQATEAASAKKRTLTELLDKMLETGTSRVTVTDPKTGRPKWLEITEGSPKLRACKAETGVQLDRQSSRTGDQYGQKLDSAGEPENGPSEPENGVQDSPPEVDGRAASASQRDSGEDSDPEPDAGRVYPSGRAARRSGAGRRSK